jgi:hypothetical protein
VFGSVFSNTSGVIHERNITNGKRLRRAMAIRMFIMGGCGPAMGEEQASDIGSIGSSMDLLDVVLSLREIDTIECI